MARPLSQATTKQALVARMRAGPQADHKAPTQFLDPTPASSTLHPASRRTMKILAPAHAKPAAHTTGHVVVRYGLVPMAQEPVLNRQRWLLQTNGHANTKDAPKHLQATRCRYTWPTPDTQKGFSTVLTHTHKGFSYSHHKDPIPHILEWIFPEYVI